MKRLLERLRCWIIKKLGGYVSCPPRSVYAVREMMLEPVKLTSIQRLTDWERYTDDKDRLLNWCKERAAQDIAMQLMGSGCVLMEAEPAAAPGEMVVRARVLAIPAKDAALYVRPLHEYRR